MTIKTTRFCSFPVTRTSIRLLTALLGLSLNLGAALLPLAAFAAAPVTHLEYDANGNLTKTTDALNHATTQQYDAVDRLIRQNQPHPTTPNAQLGTTTTQYNATNAVTRVIDPRNLPTVYIKNAFGDVLLQTSRDTNASMYTYDDAGNRLTRTDGSGAVTTYTYDAINRLTGVSYTLDPVTDETVTYSYDQDTNSIGHLSRMTDLSGSTAWSYDTYGHVTRKLQTTGNLSFEVQTLYDNSGRLSRMAYPGSHFIDYGYNAHGQISQIYVNNTLMLGNIQYQPTGAVKSWTWGNGQPYTRAMDSDGRTVQYTVGDKLQVITYDAAGRITQLYRANPATPATPIAGTSTTYAYDNLDRLTSHLTLSTSQGYQYDLNGNRTQLSIGGNVYPYTIFAYSNRLIKEAGPTVRNYTYDDRGNITGNGEDTYSYYNSGRLKQVTRAATNIYSLVYNGLGQFVKRSNNNTHYVYDEAGHLLGEYNSAGDAIQETVWLGDTPVLTLQPNNQERTADNTDTAVSNKASATGSWTATTTGSGYYGSNYQSHAAAASTTDKVVYSITPTATQGFYVYARWLAQAGNATNATYTLNPNTAGSTPITKTVNQQINGGSWVYLGSVNLNTVNPLTVTLSGQGNGTVIADAVRIVPNTPASVQGHSYNIYTDPLDTPREIRSYANQIRWSWYPEQGEAFGANVPNDNPASLGIFTYNPRFPGQLYDPASGLSYNYYRDYNSRTGRYIESDPIGLMGGVNTYLYANANPLRYTDRKGLEALPGPYGIPIPIYIPPMSSGSKPDNSGENFPGLDYPKPQPQPSFSTIKIPQLPPRAPDPGGEEFCLKKFEQCTGFANRCGVFKVPVVTSCVASYLFCRAILSDNPWDGS